MSDLPSSDPGFLSRWSRRKRLGEEAVPEPEPPEPSPERAAVDATPASLSPAERARRLLARLARRQDPATPAPAFDIASLPSLESLTAESDIAAFLQQGVPLALRNAALKRIWALDPAIRDFIGPVDYGWDFNAPDGVPGFALGLGGADVRKLLAHALGQLQEEPSAHPPPATEDERLAAAAPLPPPPGPAAMIPEPGVADLPSEPTQDRPRQRHGGALPA